MRTQTGGANDSAAGRAERTRCGTHAGRWALLCTALLLVACGPARLRSDLVDPRSVHRMQSVLVVPLQNLSGTPNAEHAVADEVAARLRFYPNLIVRELPWLQLQLRKQGVPMPESRDPHTLAALARRVGVDAVVTGAIYEYGFFREQRSVSDHVVVGLRLDLYDPQATHLIWSGSSGQSMGNELSSYRPVLSDVASEVIATLLEDMFERTEQYMESLAPVSDTSSIAPAAAEISAPALLPAPAVQSVTETVAEPEPLIVAPAANAEESAPPAVEPPDPASEQDGGAP